MSKIGFKTFLSAILLGLFASSVVLGQSIQDIRIGHEGDRTRGVIELDHDSTYAIFYLAGPPRIVVDISGLKDLSQPETRNLSNGLVRGVRLGQFNDRLTRVVFDLTESADLSESFFLRPNAGESYRLVIDLVPGQGSQNGTLLLEREGEISSTSSTQSITSPHNSFSSCYDCETIQLPVPRPRHLVPQKYIIVIDPGHGGRDPGAIGADGAEEADIVLAMAREIAAELEDAGNYEVYLTRAEDRLVPLAERAELARGRAADFFLSIHANANPDPSFRGFMTFTLSDSASDSYAAEVAARENKSELGAIANIDDEDVGTILGDILVRDTMNQSIDFSTRLVEQLRGQVMLPATPQRRAGFVVLKSVRMPSALLEIGHLTNSRELRALQSRGYRRKIAIAIRQALDDHFANN